jgi:hypothetical protein
MERDAPASNSLNRVSRTIYIAVLANFLLISGLCHVVAPSSTDHWMSNNRTVRSMGAVLLVLAIPCVLWRGWYFWTLLLALAVSGIWRLCFPQNSIRAQQTLYPRHVHGLLLIGGAFFIKRHQELTP